MAEKRPEKTQKALGEIVESILQTQREVAAIQRCLIDAGIVTEAQMVAAQDRVKTEMQTQLDELSQSAPLLLDALVRVDEGPSN